MRGSRTLLALTIFLVGCGPKYYLAPHEKKPAKIVVSSYTQEGCKENLSTEAMSRGVRVKLLKIESDLGWGIVLWPLYKSYKCTGEVVGPIQPTK